MIGINWRSHTSPTPCHTCAQRVVTKHKTLSLFGIPIPLGSPTQTCGCNGQRQAAPTSGAPAQAQGTSPGTQNYPCQRCQTTLQWSAQHQRWFCGSCNSWY